MLFKIPLLFIFKVLKIMHRVLSGTGCTSTSSEAESYSVSIVKLSYILGVHGHIAYSQKDDRTLLPLQQKEEQNKIHNA